MNVLNFQQEINNLLNKLLYSHEWTWLKKSCESFMIDRKMWPGVKLYLSVHSRPFFCKFVLHFDCSTTFSKTFLCFADFMEKRFLLLVKKLFKKSMLSCPDFASFVACVELTFWWSPSQVFCFVYLTDLERIITQFHYIFPSSIMKICHNACTDKTLA